MSISSDLIPRQAHHALARISQAFPVLALTGPRQSGKTTLARSSFPDKPYRTLEDPETRQLAKADPRAFLAQFPDGAVLDEIQNVPSLLSWIQVLTDADLDLAVLADTGLGFGVCNGATAVGMAPEGFVTVPLTSCQLAWPI